MVRGVQIETIGIGGEHGMEKVISAEKLLKWLEESDEAKGFWVNPEQSIKSFDSLTDAINKGDLDAT